MLNARRAIFAGAGLLAFGVVGWILPCPEIVESVAADHGNSAHAAMACIGSIAFALLWWIGGVAPNWLTALLMASSWAVFAGLPWEKCFIGFTGDTVWLVAGVF